MQIETKNSPFFNPQSVSGLECCLASFGAFLYSTRNPLRSGAGYGTVTPCRDPGFPTGQAFLHGGLYMSRVATPPMTPANAPVKVPHEKIAMRAYEKWCQRGRPQGTDKQDWMEA